MKNKGRRLVERKLDEVPAITFIAGRPKAALLVWFFGGFIVGVWLFIVLIVRYKYRN